MAVNLLSDRELMELAAKACKLEYFTWCGDGLREQSVHGVPHCGHQGPTWNPLADDADALRLAAKLYLSTAIKEDAVHGKYVCVTSIGKGFYFTHIEWFDKHESDLNAIRRAIVCAAAHIGRSTQ